MKKRIYLLLLIPLFAGCQSALHKDESSLATTPLKIENGLVAVSPSNNEKNNITSDSKSASNPTQKMKKGQVSLKKPADQSKVTAASNNDSNSLLCQDTLFYSSWENQFDSQWLSKNRNNFSSDAKLQKALDQARTNAFIRIVYPEIEKTGYDFPVEINAQVLSWIRYFTGHGRKNFVLWLRRGQYLIPQMEDILERHGLPKDLVYLSMIESGFNPTALSTARAVGLWQFRAVTAGEYGLKMNYWVDERRDPTKSTAAAAKLLTNLYAKFGSWHLAAASYNCGPGCVQRTLRNYGTNSTYFELTSMGVINKQTADYVPKIIAAMIVAKNPQKFGFDSAELLTFNQTKTVPVTHSVSLAQVADSISVNRRILEELNPQLKVGITPPASALPNGKFDLVVPASKYDVTLAALGNLPDASSKRILVARSKHRSNIAAHHNNYRVSLAATHHFTNPHTKKHVKKAVALHSSKRSAQSAAHSSKVKAKKARVAAKADY